MISGSSNFGTMMTLAQLSALSPNPRPSGETVEQQAQRILAGINSTLLDRTLATAGVWQAVWIGLTADRGNLVYIAASPTQNAFAVCCRGTQFNSLVDLGEDLAVSSVSQFTPGGATTPLLVSTGSMKAFTEAMATRGLPYGNLVEALKLLLGAAPSNPTVCITGHSLGGAMATMIALYLAGETLPNAPSFQVYTFAAPTAGLSAFASFYDQTFPDNAFRVYNQYDAVPYAWADLAYVQQSFYPSPSNQSPNNPGPYPTLAVRTLLKEVAALPGGNVYVQTNGNSSKGTNTTVYNQDYSTYDPAFVHSTTGDFLGQVGFQHNCYLTLLKVTLPPVAGVAGGPPAVTGITPNNGPESGGTLVTITGGAFTADCVVDFGWVPAVVVSVSATTIQAIQPPGTGTVDVRVTNMYGTSAAISADLFAAPPPLAPTVTSVSPIGGPAGGSYTVTITGTGFALPDSDYSVSFGEGNLATNVQVVSLTTITVTPPQSGTGSVDVQVTNTLGTSAANSGDRFQFGIPLVTGVSPSSGLAKDSAPVTISGVGFDESCTVFFGSKAGSKVSLSGNTLVATPPDVTILAGAYNDTVDVTVKNTTGTSPTTPDDQYMYYPTP